MTSPGQIVDLCALTAILMQPPPADTLLSMRPAIAHWQRGTAERADIARAARTGVNYHDPITAVIQVPGGSIVI